jgi:hypothetical protein
MADMTKYIIGVAVVIIIAAAGFMIWTQATSSKAKPAETPQPEPQLPVTHTYATSTFSAVYPDGYTVDESYAYEGVPKKPIAGVKFVIPGTMATGTNLSTDSGVSVESLPRAKSCTGDIYFYDNVKAQELTVGTRTWSVASTSGAGAGNFYEEYVYALKGSSPCIAVRYLIHSTNIGNYEPGTVREFDRAAVTADFDKIRDSITLPGEMSTVPTGSTTTPENAPVQ